MFYRPNPKLFRPEEFVDKKTFTTMSNLGGKDFVFTLIDGEILWTIEKIREFYGKPITINNWVNGGPFQYRGFRPIDYTQGGFYSQHRCGRALDFDISGVSAPEFRKHLLANQKLDMYKYITCVEDNVNWIHIDNRNYNRSNGILIVKP